MSVIIETGQISGFQHGQEGSVLQFSLPLTKTQVRGGIFKTGGNVSPSYNHIYKACPHLQKTIIYSHSHFLFIIIHVLSSNRPHLGTVLV